MEIRIRIPRPPIGKGRGRATTIGGAPRIYTPAKTRQEEQAIRFLAMQAMSGREPLTGPLEMHVYAYFAIPDSWSARKKSLAAQGFILPAVRPDLDNVTKLCKDALNRVVFKDDAQVVDALLRKRYGTIPHISLIVRPVAMRQQEKSGQPPGLIG